MRNSTTRVGLLAALSILMTVGLTPAVAVHAQDPVLPPGPGGGNGNGGPGPIPVFVICPDRIPEIPPGGEFPVLFIGTNLAGAEVTIGGMPVPVIECGDGLIIGNCPPMPPGEHTATLTTPGGSASTTIIFGSLCH